MTDDIREVASYASVFDARVAVAHLASEGIEASVVADNAGGAIPSLTALGGGARVLVRSDDLERARAALGDLTDRDGGVSDRSS
jgi:hypothetical protein